MAEREPSSATSPGADVGVQPKKLADTKWSQHALRFCFGGAITALAGWIAEKYGPAVGGLFLAFPAILPASLSIVKQKDGREAAGRVAYGAVPGSIGLIAFGAVIWAAKARLAPPYALVAAAIAWFIASVAALVVALRIAPPDGNEN